MISKYKSIMPPKPKTKQQAKKRIATRSRKTSDTSRSDPRSTQVEGAKPEASLPRVSTEGRAKRTRSVTCSC